MSTPPDLSGRHPARRPHEQRPTEPQIKEMVKRILQPLPGETQEDLDMWRDTLSKYFTLWGGWDR